MYIIQNKQLSAANPELASFAEAEANPRVVKADRKRRATASPDIGHNNRTKPNASEDQLPSPTTFLYLIENKVLAFT